MRQPDCVVLHVGAHSTEVKYDSIDPELLRVLWRKVILFC